MLLAYGRRPATTKLVRRGRRLSANTVLFLLMPVFLAPVAWTVVQSFLPQNSALRIPPVWVTGHPTIANYSSVFGLIPFLTFLLNSVKITAIVTLGSLITSTLAAYAFARLRFPGRDFFFFVLLAALMIPNTVTAAPTYVLMHYLHLATSQTAVWLPGLVNVFGIFLLRQFFRSIPRDLDDAGRIDGLGTIGVLRRVILPLSKPALAALAILIGTTTWNDYFWPSIYLTNQSQMTLTVGLVSLQGEYRQGSPLLMFAAVAMTVLPLLLIFIFTQRAITESLAMTSFR
jgi:multiple sugar transport system permease protein